MKKILYILIFFTSIGVYAQDTIVWLGNTDRQKIDSISYSNDTLRIKIENDELKKVRIVSGINGNYVEKDDDTPISTFKIAVGDSTSLANLSAPSGFQRIAIDTSTVSNITSDYYLNGLSFVLAGSDLTLTATRNGATNVVSNTITLPSSSVTGNEAIDRDWETKDNPFK